MIRNFLGVGGLALLTISIAACGSAGDQPTDDTSGASGSTGEGGSVMSTGTAGTSVGTAGSSSGTAGTPVSGTGGTVKPGTGGSGAGGSNVMAPPSMWKNVTANLANMASECGTLTMISAKPGSNMVIAGIAKQGLWATTDGGTTWAQLGTGGGANPISNRPSTIVYDPDHPDTFWEAGIYNGAGVFRTDDGGKTFKALGTISHNDSVSVDFTDPERKTLLAGAHETARKVFLSTDTGMTWKDIGMNLPANTNHSSQALVLGPQSFLMGVCGWLQGATCGIYGSVDGGTTWTSRTPQAPAGQPLVAKDKTIYWTKIYDGGLLKGSADGMTWAAAGGSKTDHPVELPDGRILTMLPTGVVVAGSKAITSAPPFKPESFTYSAETKTIYVSHSSCNNNVPADAIASAGFDYTAQ